MVGVVGVNRGGGRAWAGGSQPCAADRALDCATLCDTKLVGLLSSGVVALDRAPIDRVSNRCALLLFYYCEINMFHCIVNMFHRRIRLWHTNYCAMVIVLLLGSVSANLAWECF